MILKWLLRTFSNEAGNTMRVVESTSILNTHSVILSENSSSSGMTKMAKATMPKVRVKGRTGCKAERVELGRERRGVGAETEGVGEGDGRIKAQFRKDRRWKGTASKEKLGRRGCVAGKDIVVLSGPKVKIANA